MTYDKHRADLHETLREFERVTGTGNLKNAQFAMAKMVRSLVAMMDAMPQGCGGNCKCGTAPLVLPVTRLPPITSVMPPVEVVVETDGTTLADVAVELPTELAIAETIPVNEVVTEAVEEPNENSDFASADRNNDVEAEEAVIDDFPTETEQDGEPSNDGGIANETPKATRKPKKTG